VKTRPQRTVLRKIANRRTRLQRPHTYPAWDPIAPSRTTAGISRQITALGSARTTPSLLTRRELEVLHLVARGETDQGIADRLYLSRRTINCHVANILSKLEVPSRTAAAMTAARIGLL
jgi:DNA-binding NarL/FixJ family response regulator